MNLADLEAHVYARCGWDAANPGEAVKRRIDGFLNETYRQIMARKGLETLRRHIVNMGGTANRSMTWMPTCVTRIYNLWDSTNGRLLENLSTRDIRRADPRWSPHTPATDLGNPVGYTIYNLNTAVFIQPWEAFPASGSQLQVVSSSALDSGTVAVHLQGVDVTGTPITAKVPLNGTVAVDIVTPYNWAIVTKFFLSSVPDPLLTVPIAQGAIQLATPGATQVVISAIRPGRKAAQYSAITLYPTPSAFVALSADCDIVAEDLVEAGDVPILPYDFHSLLVLGAAIKEMGRREKPQQVADLRREANDLVADLLIYANRQVSSQRAPFPAAPSGLGYSQLGSMFPAGS
jgi:hypothetical protein